MKLLEPRFKFLLFAVFNAVRHPRTPLSYEDCDNCKARFNSKEPECPRCHTPLENQPV